MMEVQKDVEKDDVKKSSDVDKSEEADAVEDGGGSGVIEHCCAAGRVWIFLLLGILILVFNAVLVGIFMNVRSLTSSTESVEVMPPFVPAAAGGITGMLILPLVWKRYKLLVYGVLLLCSCTALLCAMAAVLTGTHVVQPLISAAGCVYNRMDRVCQCSTQFRRDFLQLEKMTEGDHALLRMEGVLSCDDVQNTIPGLLFTMIGMYGVVSVVCIVAAVICLLVYRTERKRKYLQQFEYGYEYSPACDPPLSDGHAEHETMLPTQEESTSNAMTLINIYTNPITNISDDDNNTNNDGNTTPSDLIYSPQDVPMGYTEACRMRRCHSFSQPRKGTLRESSPGSSTSSQSASLIGRERSTCGTVGPGKLKEHRKRGQRAVTLHGLDREQLLLILSLQMRYLQESDQSANRGSRKNEANKTDTSKNGDCYASGSQDNAESSILFSQFQRRAKTPTARQEYLLSNSRNTDNDLDYRPAKLVRSHTPQPHHFKNPAEPVLGPQCSFDVSSFLCPPQPSSDAQADDEPATVITYDLRNISKTGPVMYGRVLSSANSSTDGSLSLRNNLLSSDQNKLAPVVSITCPLPPNLSSEATNCARMVEDTVQENEKSKGQFSPNHGSLLDDRNIIPSKDLGLHNNKGRKLSRSEKNPKKEHERETAHSSSVIPLESGRADFSNKGGAVTDRWKALMGGGGDNEQAQTLWENVQMKTPVHCLTPEPNTDPHDPLLSEHNPLAGVGFHGSMVTKAAQKENNLQGMASSKVTQNIGSPYVIQDKMLKMDGYLTGSKQPNLPQNIPLIHNSNKNLDFMENKHTNQQYTDCQSAFTPIANSSTDTYDDIGEIFGLGQQVNFDQTIGKSLVENEMVYSSGTSQSQELKFNNFSQVGYPVSQRLDQPSGTQFYNRKVEGELGFGNSFGGTVLLNDSIQKMNTGFNQAFRDADIRYTDDGRDAYCNNLHNMDGAMHSHKGRKPNQHYSEAAGAQDYSSLGGTYKSMNQFNIEPSQHSSTKQLPPFQHYQHQNADISDPHRSAFHTLDHSSRLGLSRYGDQSAICDTDLNHLRNPSSKIRGLRSQSFSPPPYVPPPMYKSLESVHRHHHSRSDSSSSSEPQNTSYTSYEMPGTSFFDQHNRNSELRGQVLGRNYPQTEMRSSSSRSAQLADPRVRAFEDKRLRHEYGQISGRTDHLNRHDEIQPGGHRHSRLPMRRCQSVEEKNRIRLQPNINSHLNMVHKQDKCSGFSQNIDPGLNKTGHESERKILNAGTLFADNLNSSNDNGVKLSLHGGQHLFYNSNLIGQNRPVCADLAFMSKGLPANQIAGYVGVVKLVNSSDSDGDDFAETVI